VERVVGWFVLLATALLLAGFAYYVYHVAERKGWFKTKIPYWTYVRDAEGLRVGNPIWLMGFEAGSIIKIEPEAADNHWARLNGYNVFVQFEVKSPYFGYILSDSAVKIAATDFLGARSLEVTRGATGLVTVIESKSGPPMIQDYKNRTNANYNPLSKDPNGYWLLADESPALTERLDELASQVQTALPGILDLTNQISRVLDGGIELTENLNDTTLQLQPILENAASITARLTNGPGALGEWLLPPAISNQLRETLSSANSTLQAAGNTLTNADKTLSIADTNVIMLATSLNRALLDLSNITSNLNKQVQANDQILSQISSAIVHTDEMLQGLKKHWLLRSAFKEQPAKEPPPSPPKKGR
jgi:ABC-type transporter Mla subunit MlaD